MLTVAYLANQFPSDVEPYVVEEIQELRKRGIQVIAGTARSPDSARLESTEEEETTKVLAIQPIRLLVLLRACWLVMRRWKRIADLLEPVLLRREEPANRRLRALLHTLLGAYYAVLLLDRRVDHIHVHHGYFGSWIAMVAARLLGINFSLTLHGSDLLLHNAYVETKLANCQFCVTISEYNRQYIREHFPVPGEKIVVARLGVGVTEHQEPRRGKRDLRRAFSLVAVGRLHAVKDHAFLVRACARLRDHGVDFECAIAGEGPERAKLNRLIQVLQLSEYLTLLGRVERENVDGLYRRADVVVLTSRSEGIPLVLMEAMGLGKIVLAPAITGVPELIIHEKTGFLYRPGVLEDFVEKLLFLMKLMNADGRDATNRLDWVRHAARAQVVHNFNRGNNLTYFGDRFLERIARADPSVRDRSFPHEDPVLQQI
ncbi:MAG: glycosyltransferase family 4 protein [Candidatus Sulfotelmatobacter sp.]